MLWGVISDIHSNLEALEAVLSVLDQKGVKSYICCGDIVGYGPEPNPVIERIAKLPGLLVVRGNHDLAVLGRMDIQWFNDPAKAAVRSSSYCWSNATSGGSPSWRSMVVDSVIVDKSVPRS